MLRTHTALSFLLILWYVLFFKLAAVYAKATNVSSCRLENNPTQPNNSLTTTTTTTTTTTMSESYMHEGLSLVVIGASGDLAKKKTFPSIFELYAHGYIPKHVKVFGYARSAKTDEEFRDYLRQCLRGKGDPGLVEEFVASSYYVTGAYDSSEAFAALHSRIVSLGMGSGQPELEAADNRLFYFAIPPDVFVSTGTSIKAEAMSTTGWNRFIIEKPFGRDLKSAQVMSDQITQLFTEDQIYRIDHYLAKEMVQNLLIFRFGNTFLEPLLHRNYVESIRVTFKEDFGTQGRGGYFDNYGIMRDVMQNHLMQVLSIVAMEPPIRIEGEGSADHVRDAKVNVLKAIAPLTLDDVVLGQYVANEKGDVGYLDDPTVPRGSQTPTFATAVFKVHTPRWEGVPFIMKAGKALEERKAEVRIRFKQAPAAKFLFSQHAFAFPENELVLRLQPTEAVYMKINVKTPGLESKPIESELDLTYATRYEGVFSPDAYTRLILECLKGSQTYFVRSDELESAWKIFDPVIKQIEAGDATLLPYVYGTRGPQEADRALQAHGAAKDTHYSWVDPRQKSK